MHPLHDHVAQHLAEHLRNRRIVVWYDAERSLAPFVNELRNAPRMPGAVVRVSVDSIDAQLVEYDGSFFELRAAIEPLVSGDEPNTLFVYIAAARPDRRESVLLEIEKAGHTEEPDLERLARNCLRRRYTDGAIDDLLAFGRATYQDLARAASDTSSSEPPSILRTVFHDARDTDSLLATWLAVASRDAELEEKGARPELVKLVCSRLGIELPLDAALAKLRAVVLRAVLAGEFRLDLRCPPPHSLDGVPKPIEGSAETATRDVAAKLRTMFADFYPALADRVEAELGLGAAPIPPEALGSIDTFRFEERALLAHCTALVAAQQFEEALTIVVERERSFWVDRDISRKAQWEACRRMAELGKATTTVLVDIRGIGTDAAAWIDAYTSPDGWYRMDQAQRRLESWLGTLDDEPDERALGVVRRCYDDACNALATGFTKALVTGNWALKSRLHQTQVYSTVVADRPKPVAYFLVDSLRYEMGVELVARLPADAEVSLRPAVGALPSITPIGMAALQPGAASSFDVVEQGDKLGARIDDVFLPDRAARGKFAAARVPNLVDLPLDQVLGLPPSKLVKKLNGAQVVIVRSQEIDLIGEAGLPIQARHVMDTVIDNIARAIKKLAAAGVENAVVAADHGHLFFPTDRDESMRTDSPGGRQLELHRRCWIGRGGTTPPGCIRVAAAALGYRSDLEFVFNAGAGVFRAGGDLSYHHGGISLQELIVPVLTVRLKACASIAPASGPITVAGVPEAVTNRIFTSTLQLGGPELGLFSSAMTVRPLLVAAGKEVGVAGWCVEGGLDQTSGNLTVHAGKVVTVAMLLQDDSVASLRLVVQDPSTDAELYRSAEIPVRLGV